MQLNNAGIKLIKTFEGWRANAYMDASGVWTIGYGHTSKIGSPYVTPNMIISKQEGEKILLNDLKTVIEELKTSLNVTLNPCQFSALVSFVYNVGITNFRKSSVLRAVNNENFDEVPEKLALWNRAGKKILRGLVRRRAAEGVLFATAPNNHRRKIDINETRHLREYIRKRNGKGPFKSSTNRAGGILGLGVIAANIKDAQNTIETITNTQESLKTILSWEMISPFLLIIIATIALAWIIRERRKKSINHGI